MSKAKKKAWVWCSRYIRLRDAIEYCKATGRGAQIEDLPVQCCTCHTIKSWKRMQAGHFISRGLGGRSGVYFDERNIHAQCPTCNAFEQGRPNEYREFMLDKYGEQTIALLRIKDKQPGHYSVVDYQVLAQYWKDRFEMLK